MLASGLIADLLQGTGIHALIVPADDDRERTDAQPGAPRAEVLIGVTDADGVDQHPGTPGYADRLVERGEAGGIDPISNHNQGFFLVPAMLDPAQAVEDRIIE